MLDINTADKARKIRNFKPVFDKLAQCSGLQRRKREELNEPRMQSTVTVCILAFSFVLAFTMLR